MALLGNRTAGLQFFQCIKNALVGLDLFLKHHLQEDQVEFFDLFMQEIDLAAERIPGLVAAHMIAAIKNSQSVNFYRKAHPEAV